MRQRQLQPTELNGNGLVLWFDDLGTGNEEYRYLSNFYEGEPIELPDTVWLDGPGDRPGTEVKFPTGEHAFQALKTKDPHWFESIATARTPADAKGLGRSCPLRDDWEIVKLDVMAAVVRSKFTLAREEGNRLVETGDALLVEGTFWHDRVWGVDADAVGMPGRNWLGTLLMARRAELRALKYATKKGPFASDAIRLFVNGTAAHNVGFVG